MDWGPEELGISDKDYQLLVFDRWSEKIFEGKAFKDRWNGSYHGIPVKQGAYVYKLNCKAITSSKLKTFTGHVTVER